MKSKKYGNSDRYASILGFGAWPLGNTAHGQTMCEEEGIALVEEAVEKGVNFFDTSPNYSFGKSEIILGKALEGKRHKVMINTKFGHHEDGTIDFSESRIEPSIRGSLSRLKTTYLDSVLLHNPEPAILEGKTKHIHILKQLKQQGLIRSYGVSVDCVDEVEKTLTHLDVDVIELLYNVFAQSTRAYLDRIKAKNIALIIKVPLDSGWLSGKYNETSTFTDIRSRWCDAEKIRRSMLVDRLKEWVGPAPLIDYAMGFLWSYEAITTVIPGIRNRAQLDAHLRAMNTAFTPSLRHAFERFYDAHIADDPLPW